jgi:hypothetical protein
MEYHKINFISLFHANFNDLRLEFDSQKRGHIIVSDDLTKKMLFEYENYYIQVLGKLSFLKIINDINRVEEKVINSVAITRFSECNVITTRCIKEHNNDNEVEDFLSSTERIILRKHLKIINENRLYINFMTYIIDENKIYYDGDLFQNETEEILSSFSIHDMIEIKVNIEKRYYKRALIINKVNHHNNNNNNEPDSSINNNKKNILNESEILKILSYSLDMFYISIDSINEIDNTLCVELMRNRTNLLMQLNTIPYEKKKLFEIIDDKQLGSIKSININEISTKKVYYEYIKRLINISIKLHNNNESLDNDIIIKKVISLDKLSYWLMIFFVYSFNTMPPIQQRNESILMKKLFEEKERNLIYLKIQMICKDINKNNNSVLNYANILESHIENLINDDCKKITSTINFASYLSKKESITFLPHRYYTLLSDSYSKSFTPQILIPTPFEFDLNNVTNRTCILLKGNCYVDILDFCLYFMFQKLMSERIYNSNGKIMEMKRIIDNNEDYRYIRNEGAINYHLFGKSIKKTKI